MSIELLPPEVNHPETWHVRRNSCDCHPETCCCRKWAVFTPKGEFWMDTNCKSKAETVADFQNNF